MTPEFFRNSDKKNTINYFSTFPVINFRRSRRNRNFWGILEEFRKNFGRKSSRLRPFFHLILYFTIPANFFLANQTTFKLKYPFTWFFHDAKNNLASLHCICELLNLFVKSLRVPIKVRSRFQFQVWHFNYVKLWLKVRPS